MSGDRGVLARLKLLAFVRPPAKTPPAPYQPTDSDPLRGWLHPATPQGYPAVPIELLLERSEDIIKRIYNISRTTTDEFEGLYMQAIRSYANLVHLLPGSGGDHHEGLGGLFRHGLEVAFHACATATTRGLYDGSATAQRRKQIEIVWPFTCFIAGLCHDIGKPLSDVTVTSADGKITWEPWLGSIVDWCARHKLERYHVIFITDRAEHHKKVAPFALERVLSMEARQLIQNIDNKLVYDLIDCVCGLKTHHTPLAAIVADADTRSTSDDSDNTYKRAPVGVDASKDALWEFLHAAKSLISSGEWQVNERSQRGRVWMMNKALYLVWPGAAEDIVTWCAKNNRRGIPYQSHIMARVLLDKKALKPYRQNNGIETMYWHIQPDEIAEHRPGALLRAICLDHSELLFEVPPANCQGKIIDIETSAPEQRTSLSSENARTEGAGVISSQGQAPAASPASNEPPVPALVSRAPQAPPVGGGGGTPPLHKPAQPAATRAEREARLPQPAVEHDGPNSRNWLSQQPYGGMLLAFCDDVQLPAKDENSTRKHATYRQARVAIRWPEALAEYGELPRDLLVKLKNTGWLEPNPYQPTQIVREDMGFPAAIVFTQEISQRLVLVAPVLAQLTPANQKLAQAAAAAASAKNAVSEAPADAPAKVEQIKVRGALLATDPKADLTALTTIMGKQIHDEQFSKTQILNHSVRVNLLELQAFARNEGIDGQRFTRAIAEDRAITIGAAEGCEYIEVPTTYLTGVT